MDIAEFRRKAQIIEPRKIIVAESWVKFCEWCHDRDLNPGQVRLGKHPDYVCAITNDWGLKVRGIQRGLKWIEVGHLPYEALRVIQCRLPEWVND